MLAFATRFRRDITVAFAMIASFASSLLAQVTTGPDGRTVTLRYRFMAR